MAERSWAYGPEGRGYEPSRGNDHAPFRGDRIHRGKRGRRGGYGDPYHRCRDDSEERKPQGHFRGRGQGRGGREKHWEGPSHDRGHHRGGQSHARGQHRGGPSHIRGNPRGGSSDTGENRRERPPPGLRGREIGMWHAARSKRKAREDHDEVGQRQYVHMDMRKERHLTDLLTTIRTMEMVEPQPERSYRDPFDDGEAAFEADARPIGDSKDAIRIHVVEPTSDGHIPGKPGISYERYVYADNETSHERQVSVKTEAFGRDSIKIETSNERYVPVKTETSGHARVNTETDGFIPLEAKAARRNAMDDASTSWRSTSEIKTEMSLASTSDAINVDDSDSDEEDVTEARASLPKSQIVGDDNNDDDDDDDDDDGINPVSGSVSELYQRAIQLIDDADNPFMSEFLLHRHARNRSYENLSDMAAYVCLERDPQLDERLRAETIEREENNQLYHKMLQFRKKLPSYNMKEELLELINSNQVVVISGETGCGKTTQVAQFILDDYIARGDGSLCRIVCTQPRRISAIAVAERVAEERGERCGESAGYQIRLESQLPRQQGSILYCTTGILLKWLQSDPWLSRTSHVILDEIHERDLQSDFLMIILKELTAGRQDLKLILMSATLNALMFSQYFRDSPMMNIPGYTFPVEEYLMEDIVEMIDYEPPEYRGFKPQRKKWKLQPEQREELQKYEEWLTTVRHRYSPRTLTVLRSVCDDKVDLELAGALVHYIVRHKPEGAILVFLPGVGDIKQLNEMLLCDVAQHKGANAARNGRLLIIPLHSRMPTINQREVFSRPPPGVRKIVIATNIAETSITIDDVVYVVDGGKIKMKNFDPANNIATLKPEWVSRANAKQRRGRAGRVQPGICYHLYTQYHSDKFADYQLPEILRTRLEELCLEIKMLKLGRIGTFVGKAMQPPSMEALDHAISTLVNLNALDQNEDLTPLGYHLAKMPCDPHTSKMLLFGAMFSCLDPILTVGASLSFKDAFYIPMGKEKLADQMRQELAGDTRSDHLMLVNAYNGWERAKSRGTAGQYCWEHFLSSSILRMLHDMRGQLAKLLHEMGFLTSNNPKAADANRNSGNKQLLKAIICAGLYPNVANMYKVKKSVRGDSLLSTKTEKRILLHPQSVNWSMSQFSSRWMVYHLKMMTSKIFLFDTTMVSPYPLLFFGGKITVRKEDGVDSIIVDDWIKFRASKRIAQLVKELRIELDRLLAYKVTHPGASCWQPQDKEGVLLQAIIDLITTEDTAMVSAGVRLLT